MNKLLVVFIFGSLCGSAWSKRTKQAKEIGNTNTPADERDSNDPIPEFSCNFDDNVCGWTNDSKADFMWERHRGKTPSEDTGPPWDHTTKDAVRGYYLYIESSSPRRKGDRARIVSPQLEKPGKYCLNLWHHMHGSDVKDLNIYAKEMDSKRQNMIGHLSGAWSTEGTVQRRSFGGNGDWWNEHQTEFVTEKPVVIIIEGVRGLNYRGDIAIDDITLRHTACSNQPVNCDFENNTCGWIQMSGDQFNWLPNKGKTPSRSTGPSIDHTLGTGDGRYLYIEASWPRREGDRARLFSPPITCIEDARPVFRLWYHMYGSTVGPLRVYLVRNETADLGQPIWQMTGEQGDSWKEAKISIPRRYVSPQEKFHIIIEGERKEYRGDAAIDDVALIGCYSLANEVDTVEETTTTAVATTTTVQTTFQPTLYLGDVTTLPDDLDCSFDEETICAWSHDHGGQFFWTLHQGKTPSFKTGPLYDHTSHTGWYIFTEASAPRLEDDQAMLRSPTISSNIKACLRFYYNMYGSSMGKLEILTARGGRNRFNQKWSVEGKQSTNESHWLLAEVDIEEKFNYDIILRGVRGDNFYSDIAVDDITVTSRPCHAAVTPTTTTTATSSSPSTPVLSNTTTGYQRINCNFDGSSLCYWSQMQDDDFDFSISSHGRTPSRETGPSGDHTGGGEFTYVEASRPRQQNDKARIQSPSFSITVPVCFSLWFHMFGNDTGSLTILRSSSTNRDTAPDRMREKKLWSEDGLNENIWKQIQLTIFEPGESQVIIAATVADGWRGDIAIDDLLLEEGECPIFNCTFQTGLCGWTQEQKQDDFDWTRSQTATPTANTGPQYDHTYQTDDGNFLFIETSSPRDVGDSARLVSPVVNPDETGSKCLRFWYHSYGNDIGALNVYKRNVNARSRLHGSPLWYQAEDEGDQWLHAKVTIQDNSPFEIILEGVRGVSYLGDIAIDDVTISDGECPSCCGPEVFRCGNYFCVPSTARCNGIDECGDGSDESFCDGCGTTRFKPSISSNFGKITNLGTAPVVTSPISAHRFQPESSTQGNGTNATPKSKQRVRVLTIKDDQKERLQHPGRAWFHQQRLDIDTIEENSLLPPATTHNKVEIIRSRRSVQGSSEASSFAIKSRLLRNYKNKTKSIKVKIDITSIGKAMDLDNHTTSEITLTENTSASQEQEQDELEKGTEKEIAKERKNGKKGKKQLKSKQRNIQQRQSKQPRRPFARKFFTRRPVARTSVFRKQGARKLISRRPNAGKPVARRPSAVKRRPAPRLPWRPTRPNKWYRTSTSVRTNKLPYKPVKPRPRGAMSIPTWQWKMIRKSTKRDKEETNSDGLVERMKRSVLLRITGGSEAKAHSWPWQAAYYITDSQTDSYYFCGGTVIDRYWIVTAAHCPQLGDVHLVVVGDHDLYEDEGTEQELKVEAIYVNQAYRFSEDLIGDIALIKLKYPVRTNDAVQPACLMAPDDERFSTGHVCAITGWGGTDVDDHGLERILRQGEVPITTRERCQSIFTPTIHDSMFCAGGTGANTCRGDSGGPLICERNNTAFLVGITSFGDDRCLPNIPGVYTRLQSYMDWMSRIMNQPETCS